MAREAEREGRNGRSDPAGSLPCPFSDREEEGTATLEALATYEAYLVSLRTRRNHGDRAFPLQAVRDLVVRAMAEAVRECGDGPAKWSGEPAVGHSVGPAGGAWAAACLEARVAGLSTMGRSDIAKERGKMTGGGLLPVPRRMDGMTVIWATLLWPVGVNLGPWLLDALGGRDLWTGAPACHVAAAFTGRLPGVRSGARRVLLSLDEREDGTGPLGLKGGEIPAEALLAASALRVLGIRPVPPAGLGPEERAWQVHVLRATSAPGPWRRFAT